MKIDFVGLFPELLYTTKIITNIFNIHLRKMQFLSTWSDRQKSNVNIIIYFIIVNWAS